MFRGHDFLHALYGFSRLHEQRVIVIVRLPMCQFPSDFRVNLSEGTCSGGPTLGNFGLSYEGAQSSGSDQVLRDFNSVGSHST